MRGLLNRRPSPAMIVALIALILGAAGGALAGRGGGHKSFVVGTATSKGFVDRTTPAFNSNSTSLVPIPGAKLSLKTPRRALLVATFNATSRCSPDLSGSMCEVLIKIDGKGANPKHQGPFDSVTFDNHASSAVGRAHSITVDRKVGAGRHTVKAFYHAVFTPAQINLWSWHLFAQAMPR
jgi:hypothetical protein